MADPAPGEIETWLEQGLLAWRDGRASEALELWYRVLDKDPQNPRALELVQYVRDNLHVDVKEPAFAVPAAGEPVGPVGDEEILVATEVLAEERTEPESVAPAVQAAPPPVREVEGLAMQAAPPPAAEPEPPAVEAMPPAAPEPPLPLAASAPTPAESSMSSGSLAAVALGGPSEETSAPAQGADWGDLAFGDVDLDPVTGKTVQRAAESDSIERRRSLVVGERPEEALPQEAAPEEAAPAEAAPEVAAPEVALPEEASAPVEPPAEATPAAAPPLAPPTPQSAAPVALPVETEPRAAPSPPPVGVAPALLEEHITSPWDGHSGVTEVVNLDAAAVDGGEFEALLAGAPRPGGPAAAREAAPSPAAASSAAAADAPPPATEMEALLEGVRELFDLGDFSGSLELTEKVLAEEPGEPEALQYRQRNEETLLKMYESKLGDLATRPRVLTTPDEVIWMNLHHRAGFLLSQVDGELAYEDIAAISGMSRLETFRILADLVSNGVIG